ncbi:uncharacterized protein LOC131147897 [Malania oleifera]|uniref:uncharacterized protein LOC131147897 n=1 Tax=Malania oleifera TaxID=397392 RepID=UPI0025AE8900|nr:uncharacterized protein LOC131147897 [Malania oleifera]
MDKYLVPLSPTSEAPKPNLRPRWKRSLVELHGRFQSKYRHEFSGLLMQSYSQVGSYAHSYHIGGVPCQTHVNGIADFADVHPRQAIKKQGISSLDFDTKGIYLASVTKLGCLTVHDFETLHCNGYELSPCLKEDETTHLLHLSTHQQLDIVRWNIANQDEIACASMKSNEVLIFDVGYISSRPVEVLRKRHAITVHGCDIQKGLSDIAFISNDESRLLASDIYGAINLWDRRMSDLPCLELRTNSGGTLNSIQLDVENQIIFGAGKHGNIYMWDLRGGRTSAAFQSHKEVHHHPLTSIKLASVLEKIGSLKAQSDIIPKEVHSINLDPSCPYQLAFHLDDGWSGVLDIHNFQVTHIHCPPPAWLNGSNLSSDLSYLRKPSWLPTSSIYAIGSSSDAGIHLLDFYPDPSSPCHVDYDENMQIIFGIKNRHRQNSFVPLTEIVTVCATHPLDGSIVAGTKQSSLLVISQRHQSCKGCEDFPSIKPER